MGILEAWKDGKVIEELVDNRWVVVLVPMFGKGEYRIQVEYTVGSWYLCRVEGEPDRVLRCTGAEGVFSGGVGITCVSQQFDDVALMHL